MKYNVFQISDSEHNFVSLVGTHIKYIGAELDQIYAVPKSTNSTCHEKSQKVQAN